MDIFTQSALRKIWLFLCALIVIIGGFLLWSYVYFRAQVNELMLLRDHCQEHVEVLKRVIADVLVNGKAKDSTASVEQREKQKQLYQSLRSYLQQKDSNIDVQDLQELYRSFDQPAELKPDEQVTIQPQPVSVVSAPEQVKKTRIVPRIKKKSTPKKRFFGWPLERRRFWLSSFFGRRRISRGKWAFHNGLDMAAIKGTPVRAAAEGKVLEAGDSGGFGNTVLLGHMQGFKTRYAHLERVRVHVGQNVQRGQVIGTVGDTGNVRANGTDASHLHFEVHRHSKPVNPLYHLS
jgi:murein DD-endopeptidase MepM/ murein hydrolase activator NlpD